MVVKKVSLKETFTRLKAWKFMFVAPGGNQGDSMIYAGAYKLADEVGLEYRPIFCGRNSPIPKISNEIIYLHGGGGFCRWWNRTLELLRKLRKVNPKNHIIIGPTTVDTDRNHFNRILNMDNRMTFFARERTTYNAMQDYCNDVYLDHDTALYLHPSDIYFRKLVGNLKSREDFSLLVLRSDNESLKRLPSTLRREDFDRVVDPCRHKNWARLHMHASRIVSDRSHSAIMGAILGKDTSLFAGAYHKNKSIWDYSLHQRGVKWIGNS